MRTSSQKGFTLLELIAVFAIAALMMVAGAVTIRSVRRADVSTAAQKLATAIRYTYDTAVLNNGTYRMVFDFDSSSWWVERVETSQTCGGVAILPGEDDEAGEEDGDRAGGSNESDWSAQNPFDGGSIANQVWNMGGAGSEGGPGAGAAGGNVANLIGAVQGADSGKLQASLEDLSDEERAEIRRQRSRVRDDLLRKMPLPRGIGFKMVMTSHQEEPTEEGTAELFFFPSGYVERAYIYLVRDDDVYTIETIPLRGLGIVHKEELSVESMLQAY